MNARERLEIRLRNLPPVIAESGLAELDEVEAAARAAGRADGIRDAAAKANPAAPEVSFFGPMFGPQVAAWLEMLAAAGQAPAPQPCCHLHKPSGCCDPEDCGSCCEDCPTCPTLQRHRAAWRPEDHAGHGSPCETDPNGSCARPRWPKDPAACPAYQPGPDGVCVRCASPRGWHAAAPAPQPETAPAAEPGTPTTT